MHEKPTWSPTWHAMDNIHDPADFASNPPQRGGSNTNQGEHDT